MVLEPNVPRSVRNWALCQVMLREEELAAEKLAAGQLTSIRQVAFLKTQGRRAFIEQVARPEFRRLETRMRRYRAVARAVESRCDPRKYLLGTREQLELIGHTLHCSCRTVRTHHVTGLPELCPRTEMFVTLQYCSSDGKYLFSETFDPYGPVDVGIGPLDLLSLGFGRASDAPGAGGL